jgi:hypothetical protein
VRQLEILRQLLRLMLQRVVFHVIFLRQVTLNMQKLHKLFRTGHIS